MGKLTHFRFSGAPDRNHVQQVQRFKIGSNLIETRLRLGGNPSSDTLTDTPRRKATTTGGNE